MSSIWDSVITCLNIETGDVNWTIEAERGPGKLDANEILYIYASEAGNHLYAIDKYGNLLYSKRYDDYYFYGGLSFTSDGYLEFSNVYCVSKETGGLTVYIDKTTGELQQDKTSGAVISSDEYSYQITYAWDQETDEYIFFVSTENPAFSDKLVQWDWSVAGDKNCWELRENSNHYFILRPISDTWEQVLNLTATFQVNGNARECQCKFEFMEKQGVYIPIFNDVIQWDDGRF